MKLANPIIVKDHQKEANRKKHLMKLVVNNKKSEERPSVKEKKHLIYDMPIFKAKRHDPY